MEAEMAVVVGLCVDGLVWMVKGRSGGLTRSLGQTWVFLWVHQRLLESWL